MPSSRPRYGRLDCPNASAFLLPHQHLLPSIPIHKRHMSRHRRHRRNVALPPPSISHPSAQLKLPSCICSVSQCHQGLHRQRLCHCARREHILSRTLHKHTHMADSTPGHQLRRRSQLRVGTRYADSSYDYLMSTSWMVRNNILVLALYRREAWPF